MIADRIHDTMQVCANGHVITDLLHTHPEQGLTHCDRCGAATLARCGTCGRELPGAIPVPGLEPVGKLRAPEHCPTCGASFPWTGRRGAPRNLGAFTTLENLLRRLPLAARQLRSRHGDRPAFRVEDVFDLEDLLRALLPLHFDEVRPEVRTPRYSPATRTDFLLVPEGFAVTAKHVTPELGERQLAEQIEEDVAYYQGRGNCQCLVSFVYDPGQRLYEPRRLETAWRRDEADLEVRGLIAS
jgi:hypothetical protein